METFRETFTKVSRDTGATLGTITVERDLSKLPLASLYRAAARGLHEIILDSYAGAKTAEEFDSKVHTTLANIDAGTVRAGSVRTGSVRDPVEKEVKVIVAAKVAEWQAKRKRGNLPKASDELVEAWKKTTLNMDQIRALAEKNIADRAAIDTDDGGLSDEELLAMLPTTDE